MLEVLILGLTVMQEEAASFVLQINLVQSQDPPVRQLMIILDSPGARWTS